MNEKEMSLTAIRVAVRRAAHYLLAEEPKILTDPFAGPLAGYLDRESVLLAYGELPISNVAWMDTPFMIRNRVAEDELSKAVAGGVVQYVILGAGLDSFAYRAPETMRHLTVFEVDHPASQNWKRERVAALGLQPITNLAYVPCDFEVSSLTEALSATAINRSAPVFVSWLGVTQYLNPAAVTETLQQLGRFCGSGSDLVVQFIAPASYLNAEEAEILQRWCQAQPRLASHGSAFSSRPRWSVKSNERVSAGSSIADRTNSMINICEDGPIDDEFRLTSV
jgi:methyltransferase (TIGR00027 family)